MKPHDTAKDSGKNNCCKEEKDYYKDNRDGCTSTDCCQEASPYVGCCDGTCGCEEEETTSRCCQPPEIGRSGDPTTSRCRSGSNGVENQETIVGELQTLLDVANEKYIRLYSDFENFKKRTIKERIMLADKANEQTLQELLPIIDDFERSIDALQGDASGTHMQQAMQEGIRLIYDKLQTFLTKFSVQVMRLEEGSTFNADLHEAIMQQPVEDEAMKGKVISIVAKGYLINEYVLRFAKVVIGV